MPKKQSGKSHRGTGPGVGSGRPASKGARGRQRREKPTDHPNPVPEELEREIEKEREAFAQGLGAQSDPGVHASAAPGTPEGAKAAPSSPPSEPTPLPKEESSADSRHSEGEGGIEAQSPPGGTPTVEAAGASAGGGEPSEPKTAPAKEILPARMVNEFVYCPRLFYYEFVEGVFVESADTVRGANIHKKVDQGEGALPPAEGGQADSTDSPEIIHSRSVELCSERLGVTAKMDLVEGRIETEDLFSPLRVSPVDYKAGGPKQAAEANELWDADKVQLGLQCLILRDQGYLCDEGVVYYRKTQQRVRLTVTPELEEWIESVLQEARKTMTQPIPAPLVNSPKCPRCSLVGVCLPDETNFLATGEDPLATGVEEGLEAGVSPAGQANQEETGSEASASQGTGQSGAPGQSPRRLIATRHDTMALYLNTQGIRVGCKGRTLQVKEDRNVIEEYRIKDLSHVALFGNIQLSTQAIQVLCSAGIPVTYFSMGGRFYGITHGHHSKNIHYRAEQFRQGFNPQTALRLARRYVYGKIRNQRLLMRRNHIEAPARSLQYLQQLAKSALKAESLEKLLGIEGSAAAEYFKHFNGMLKLGESPPQVEPSEADARFFSLSFEGRNRRPPRDPVNALLSLAYSLLTKDCTKAAYGVGLDPYFGFFHQPRNGRPALALDIMEEFRPLIADSAVLTAINNRMITSRHFVRAGDSVALTDNGRKLFFQAYEKRLSGTVVHPVFNYQVSYRRALELQFRILAGVLSGEIKEYIPFLTR